MPLALRADIVEGKVYRGKKKRDDEDEANALKELQKILAYKNRKICSCEAQIHDLLENCLYCGRLSCVVEGPGKCLTCGNLILDSSQRNRFKQYIDIMQVQPAQAFSAGASGLKTRIIDNQYDQVAIQNKKYITQEDRAKMSENLTELQRQRYQRKLMLDIDIENLENGVVPIRSVPMVDDYAGELQRLQLDDQPSLFGTKELLSELVFREYKRNYDFVYVESKPETSSKQSKPRRQTTNTDQSKPNKQIDQSTKSKGPKTNQAKPDKQDQQSNYPKPGKRNNSKKQTQSKGNKNKPRPVTAWNQQPEQIGEISQSSK